MRASSTSARSFKTISVIGRPGTNNSYQSTPTKDGLMTFYLDVTFCDFVRLVWLFVWLQSKGMIRRNFGSLIGCTRAPKRRHSQYHLAVADGSPLTRINPVLGVDPSAT